MLLIALVAGATVRAPIAAADAAAPRHVRIGVLAPLDTINPEAGLREGLARLGYAEGETLTIERRGAGSEAALQLAASALLQSRIDVIVALGTPAARAALAATSDVPVVFISGDALGMGLAASLARPGANATGVSTLTLELIPKRLELLRQVTPHLRRIMLLGNPSNTRFHDQVLQQTRLGASALQMQLIELDARNLTQLDTALRAIRHEQGTALMVGPDVLFLGNKRKIAEAVTRSRLPAIFPWPDDHDPGVLMAYGASTKEMGLRAAIYVDRILKGAKPAELPVEQISKYELVIDLRAAKNLGIKVPQELLLRADRVIR